jgi:hypothetical protein
VTYRSLLKERRRDLHVRTVEVIERAYAAVLGEHVERLVHHALRGEVWEKVATYGARAGTRVADRSAPAEMQKAYFETAVEALGRLPERRETSEQTIEYGACSPRPTSFSESATRACAAWRRR